MAAVEPNVRAIVRANRAFLGRAVRFLAASGIRQFLDIGSGIPTAGNVHEIAQQAAPGARVAYADIDRVQSGCSHALAGTRTASSCAGLDRWRVSDIRRDRVPFGSYRGRHQVPTRQSEPGSSRSRLPPISDHEQWPGPRPRSRQTRQDPALVVPASVDGSPQSGRCSQQFPRQDKPCLRHDPVSLPVTSRPRDHPTACVQKVLLELGGYEPPQSLFSQIRSTFLFRSTAQEPSSHEKTGHRTLDR